MKIALGAVLAVGLTGTTVLPAAMEPLPYTVPAAVTDRLLASYRQRPGRQIYDGEHVGKWLHAAVLAWANTGDAALRAKLDYTVAELCKCQLTDGYLGTWRRIAGRHGMSGRTNTI